MKLTLITDLTNTIEVGSSNIATVHIQVLPLPYTLPLQLEAAISVDHTTVACSLSIVWFPILLVDFVDCCSKLRRLL